MPIDYKPKVKFFVTTKADLATEKVNEWLEEHEDEIDVLSFQPFMSYTGLNNKGAYMIGCMISYIEVPEEDRVYTVSAPIIDEPPTFGMNYPRGQNE